MGTGSGFVIILALCAIATAAVAESWQTVDDMSPGAQATSIVTDSSGNLFVAGSAKDALGRSNAVVMKGGDGGLTWDNDPSTPEEEPSDAVPGVGGYFASFRAIACANVPQAAGPPQDHLVTVGQIMRAVVNGRVASPWLVRRSITAGSWETIDEFIHPTYLPVGTVHAVSIDGSGIIYVAGSFDETIVTYKGRTAITTRINHWVIRRGVPNLTGTVDWTTSDIPHPISSESERYNCYPSGLACIGSDVYVVGGGGSAGAYWQVYKSVGGNAPWTLVDNFRLSKSWSSHAFGIAADAGGSLYVVGLGGGISSDTWVVRKSGVGGIGWNTSDLYQYSNEHAVAYGVTVSPNNDVYVTGAGWQTVNVSASTPTARPLHHWITRKRSATTGAWSNSDDFAYATTGSSVGKGIATDSAGNTLSAGYATDSLGQTQNWLVRKGTTP